MGRTLAGPQGHEELWVAMLRMGGASVVGWGGLHCQLLGGLPVRL